MHIYNENKISVKYTEREKSDTVMFYAKSSMWVLNMAPNRCGQSVIVSNSMDTRSDET